MRINKAFIRTSVENCYALMGIHWVQITKVEAMKLLQKEGIIIESDFEIELSSPFDRVTLYFFFEGDEHKIISGDYRYVRDKATEKITRTRRATKSHEFVGQFIKCGIC